jgi:hypothetical protein
MCLKKKVEFCQKKAVVSSFKKMYMSWFPWSGTPKSSNRIVADWVLYAPSNACKEIFSALTVK